jgi:hypothetical protein
MLLILLVPLPQVLPGSQFVATLFVIHAPSAEGKRPVWARDLASDHPPINVVVPSKHELNFACAPSTRGEHQRLKGVREDGAHERQCEENAAENRRRDQEARGAHGGLPLLKLGLAQVNERTNSPFHNHLGPCGQHKRKPT